MSGNHRGASELKPNVLGRKDDRCRCQQCNADMFASTNKIRRVGNARDRGADDRTGGRGPSRRAELTIFIVIASSRQGVAYDVTVRPDPSRAYVLDVWHDKSV